MNFNTIEFLYLFLPITLILFYLAPCKARLPILIVSSFIFYAYADLIPFYFLIISIFWSFLFTFFIKRKKKINIFAAISVPLVILFLFRYLDFTLDIFSFSRDEKMQFSFFLGVLLPAGISFYTFQIISYSIDVITKKIKHEKNFLIYTTYISLFPQLIAGPILRFSQIKYQLYDILNKKKLKPEFKHGFKLITFGLFLKVLCADRILIYNEKTNINELTSFFEVLHLTISYSYRIYFDFWAYSIMAIGLAKLFSINLPRNFLQPYLSKNPVEFWKRWHITLSYWLRDYIYIPMGGNKNYTKNIFITFAICGLWHGAGWNFLLWGFWHAIYIFIYKLFQKNFDVLPNNTQILINFSVITLGWPLFFLDLHQFSQLINILFTFQNFSFTSINIGPWLFIIIISFLIFSFNEEKWLFEKRNNNYLDHPLLQALVFFICSMFLSFPQTFIYFRF